MQNSKVYLVPISQNEDSASFNKLFLQNEGSDHVAVKLATDSVESNNGYINVRRNAALSRMPETMLPIFLQHAGLTIDGKKNELKAALPTKLEGIVQVQKSFEPFYTKADGTNQDPVTTPDGEVVMRDGKEYYRQTVYLSDTSAPREIWGTNAPNEEGNLRFTPNVEAQKAETEGVTTQATPKEAFQAEPKA